MGNDRVKASTLLFNCSKNTTVKSNVLFWTKTFMVHEKMLSHRTKSKLELNEHTHYQAMMANAVL